jgi:catechol 2,3-dioxygenase-like lactoylglutathione lyase family enzyme
MTRPEIGSMHHVALRTSDVDRLEQFYAGVLGLPAVRRDALRGSVWLRLGDGVLMLERADADEPAVPAATRELIAFSVEDRDAWRSWLAAAGVPIEGATEHTLYFRDPDGRRLAVSTYPLRAASP